MSRSKKKRKAELKRNREKRKLKGKPVYFSIANNPKKLKGRNSFYYYKVNLHNIIFKGASFKNSRFKAGHMTNCNLRNAKFIGCDFVAMNLKESDFRNAQFINCCFFNCKLDGANFQGSQFKNTYFMSTKLSNTKNLELKDVKIVKSYPNFNLIPYLKYKISYLYEFKKIREYGVLNIDKNTINFWFLNILLQDFSQKELSIFLSEVCQRRQKRQKNYITLYSFTEEMERFFNK